MERLAASLPQPVIVSGHADHSEKDETFLNSKPTRQALSLFRERNNSKQPNESYRKRFEGSLLLSVQYRMHPSISAFSSALFYDGLLSTPSFLAKKRLFPDTLRERLPSDNSTVGVRFIHVAGRCNERRGIPSAYSVAKQVFVPIPAGSDQPTSYWNEEEAVQVVSLIKEMLREHDSEGAPYPTSIGVVTPYNGQVELIKSLMATDDDFKSLSTLLSSVIEVKSVDGYQGRERDVIIFSAVRSNRQGKVGFLQDWRRMNVALTRARSALIVVGDLDTLTEGDKHWAAFGAWCKGMKCIIGSNSPREEETPPLS
jgi:regulator of nonsense transcripts 1